MIFGMEKLPQLANGEKTLKMCSFVSTESTNVADGRTDGQTDGRTLRDGIGSACIASRGKNALYGTRVSVPLPTFCKNASHAKFY